MTPRPAVMDRSRGQPGAARPKTDPFDSRKIRRLVPLLVEWFATNARHLPWRRTLDPYAIWVSEIMLQQTQVKAVIPYWERWMRQFPTPTALARAKLDQVLKLWEGLGYYTRARNLQRAARFLVSARRGQFPSAFDEILLLPGVGRSTAGAIASIAFDQPTPILDGNVVRVLTRLFGIAEDPRRKITNESLWHLSQALVSAAAAQALKPKISDGKFRISGPSSFFNQALMELGAVTCKPRQPQCGQCPLGGNCVAHRTGQIQAFPAFARRAPMTARKFVALVVEHGGKWLVRQRPRGVVNACLWEFPNAELNGPNQDPAAVASSLLGIKLNGLKPLTTVKHSITRYRIRLEGFRAEWRGPRVGLCSAGRWMTLGQLQDLPFASAHRKLLRALLPEGRQFVHPSPVLQ